MMRLRLSLRSKLLLALLAVTLLTGVVTVQMALRFLIAYSRQQADQELLNSSRTVLLTLELMQEKALANAETVALLPDFREALVHAEHTRLVRLTRRIMQERHLDYIVTLDATGTVLARAHAPDRYGDNLSSLSVVDVPLRGMTVATVSQAPPKPLFAGGGAPVFERQPPYRLLGVVVAGYVLDDAFVGALKSSSGKDISLLVDTTRLHSTLRGAEGISLAGSQVADATLPAAVLATGESRQGRIDIGGQTYRTIYAALSGRDGGKPLGVIEIAASEAVAHTAVSKMVRFMLVIAAGIGVLAVSVAVWLSSRLTRPLQRLARAAVATGAGDLNQLVYLRSGDEVETLASAFNQMTRDLHAKMITIAQSEERFRNLIEGSVQGIIIHRDGRALFVNSAFARLLGYDEPQEVLALPDLAALIAPQDRVRLQQFYDDRLLENVVPNHYEYQGIRKDGTVVWLDSVARAVTWEGHPAVQLTVVDITERKQAEEALRTSQTELLAKTESLTMLNTIADTLYRPLDLATMTTRAIDAIITYLPTVSAAIFAVDDAAHELYLVAARDFFEEIMHTAQRLPIDNSLTGLAVTRKAVMVSNEIATDERIEPQTQRVLAAHGFTQAISVPLLFQDRVLGAMNMLFTESHTLTDQEFDTLLAVGKTIGVALANAQYVTQVEAEIVERTRVEEALRHSEERYRAVVEDSLQGILVHWDGIIQYINPACAQMFGYASPDDLIGQNFWETLFAPEAWEELQARVAALLGGEPLPVHYGWPGIRQDGSRIWIASTASIITSQNQPAIVSFFTDMSELRQAEEAQKHLQDQLRQAQKMEAIGTLAGGIAHDFNNILAAIMGYTELALHLTPSESTVASYLDKVCTASMRAKDLVQQILTFGRQTEPQRIAIQLPLVVKEALDLMRASLPTTIAIQQGIDQESGTILADPVQIQQVVLNLGANAAYAMRDTGGELEVRVEAVEVDTLFADHHPPLHPGSHVRITVRDTGPGMLPEIMERIFEPYFTTKKDTDNAGLGLAVVYGIVRNHDGALTVESARGAGTTFAVYFPRIADVAEHEHHSEEPTSAGHECVLFVDDEEMVTAVGSDLLTHLGYDVVACTSSLEAMELFRADPHRFDMVITDQTMPHLTGEALARELRYIHPTIPIILCTGFSQVIDAEKARAHGIDAFLMKPLRARDLGLAIQQVLAKRAEELG